MDRIDQIIDALNAVLPDSPVGRDAMEDDTPEDWGAVELSGAEHIRADGHVIDSDWTADIWICAADRGSEMAAAVAEVLAELADEWCSVWSVKDRGYLYDIDKVLWHWVITVPEPLEIPDPEPAPDPDPEPDPEPAPDPDPDPEPDPEGGDQGAEAGSDG